MIASRIAYPVSRATQSSPGFSMMFLRCVSTVFTPRRKCIAASLVAFPSASSRKTSRSREAERLGAAVFFMKPPDWNAPRQAPGLPLGENGFGACAAAVPIRPSHLGRLDKLAIMAINSAGSTGFATWCWKPAITAFTRSSALAYAVNATAGVSPPRSSPSARTRRISE